MRNKMLAIGLAALIAFSGLTMLKADDDDDGDAPTAAQIAFAEETSGLLVSSLVAGLVDVFLAERAFSNSLIPTVRPLPVKAKATPSPRDKKARSTS